MRMIGQLEELAARDRDLFDGEAVDVVERLELVLDALPSTAEAEPGGDQAEQARGVDVAHELQRVLGAIGDLVDVDEERMQLRCRP